MLPLTVVGVIAPRVNVIAGVDVDVATDPDIPFAVTIDRSVTVPDPAGFSYVNVPEPLFFKNPLAFVRLCIAFSLIEFI